MNIVTSSITAQTLSGGVFVSVLTPFGEGGELALGRVTAQTRLLAGIPGVRGIAVNKVAREHDVLSVDERCTIIEATRRGLGDEQLLFACVGELTEDALGQVALFKEAGANVIVSLTTEGNPPIPFQDRTQRWIRLTEDLALPVILSLGQPSRTPTKEITFLAQDCSQILGFEFGGDDVVQYDQGYYAAKAADRPVAVLSSSQGALFHNLNTGGDGVLSCLAYIVPYEVVALYQATQDGRFFDAQAIHAKLSPLLALLAPLDASDREKVLRYAAHHRGLLPNIAARGVSDPRCAELEGDVAKTLADMPLTAFHVGIERILP